MRLASCEWERKAEGCTGRPRYLKGETSIDLPCEQLADGQTQPGTADFPGATRLKKMWADFLGYAVTFIDDS